MACVLTRTDAESKADIRERLPVDGRAPFIVARSYNV
jgi:hypothetical protein